MARQPLVLDSDPGLDDAVALHYLLARPEWELLAYTAVGGNVPIEITFRNARALGIHAGVSPAYSRIRVRGRIHPKREFLVSRVNN
jgi:inosine-uridine nucleoside N-ribohydrolase